MYRENQMNWQSIENKIVESVKASKRQAVPFVNKP